MIAHDCRVNLLLYDAYLLLYNALASHVFLTEPSINTAVEIQAINRMYVAATATG